MTFVLFCFFQIKKLELRKIPKKDIDLELKKYSDEDLESCEIKKLDFRIVALESRIVKAKPNLKVIDDYYEKVKIFFYLKNNY